jgi:hypothetical protein
MTTRLGRLSALSAAACALIVLSGCGTQHAGTPGGPAPESMPSPRQRAEADAARIIASFPRPPGAVRTGLIATLAEPGERPVTPDVATVTRWWHAPGQPQAVLAWVSAHMPAGFTLGSSGSGDGSWVDQFALPAVPYVLTQRSLVVAADFGAAMRLTFRTSRAGPVVARLNAEYGGCGIVSASIRGHDQPALSDYTRSGQPLQQRVLAIAAIRWSYPLGAPPT